MQGNLAHAFLGYSRLMFQGKINVALWLLSQQLGKGGVLHVDDTVDCGKQHMKSVQDIS